MKRIIVKVKVTCKCEKMLFTLWFTSENCCCYLKLLENILQKIFVRHCRPEI